MIYDNPPSLVFNPHRILLSIFIGSFGAGQHTCLMSLVHLQMVDNGIIRVWDR